MLTPTRAALVATLAAAGHPLLELNTPGQGALLVLPYGGRVLGLFAEEPGENFLWVNPALAEVERARAFLGGNAWVHSGGDRTWVSPEVEFHVGDLADPWNTYQPPRVIDPGQYSATQTGQTITLINRARAHYHQRRVDLEIEIEKAVRLIANPLHAEPALNGVAYAGYETATTLRLLEPDGAPPISLWSLAVLPATGWMIVPTWGQAAARDFFEPTGPTRLVSAPHAVRFLIDGQEQHKIGIRAEALTGRAGLLRSAGPEHSTLLVRQFVVNPSGDYIDTPWEARDQPGYAFQSYNSGKTEDGGADLGVFGELEYHTPAIGGDSGQTSLTDISQVWAFAGPSAQIEAIGRRLLGADSLP